MNMSPVCHFFIPLSAMALPLIVRTNFRKVSDVIDDPWPLRTGEPATSQHGLAVTTEERTVLTQALLEQS